MKKELMIQLILLAGAVLLLVFAVLQQSPIVEVPDPALRALVDSGTADSPSEAVEPGTGADEPAEAVDGAPAAEAETTF